MNLEVKSYLKLHLIVWIWGFTAVLGLLISLPAVEVVFYRTGIASVALLILLRLRKRSLRLGVNTWKVLGTGAIIAAHWILFFAAARVSNASVTLAGMATCSFWTSLLEPLMTKRKIKGYEVFLGLVVILGLYIVFRFEFSNALGLSMAVLSAFLSAVFTVINGKFSKQHAPYVITFYEMAGACLSTLVFLPFYKFFLAPDQALHLLPVGLDWLWLGILALVCTVYAFSVSVEIMQRLTAFVVNLTVNLEPVYGIILAVLIFGDSEKMNGGFYIGTLVILMTVLSYPVLNRINKRRALRTDHLR